MAKKSKTKKSRTAKRPRWLLASIIVLALLLVWIALFPDGKIAAADRALDEFVLGLFRK